MSTRACGPVAFTSAKTTPNSRASLRTAGPAYTFALASCCALLSLSTFVYAFAATVVVCAVDAALTAADALGAEATWAAETAFGAAASAVTIVTKALPCATLCPIST